MKIIDHEIKRYVVRVKEFKEKTNKVKAMEGSPDFEAACEDARKDERKLVAMIKK